LLAKTSVPLVGTTGGVGRRRGCVSLGAERRGVSADKDRQRLTGTNRLARRDQHSFHPTSDGSANTGSSVDHRLDPSGETGFATAATSYPNDVDA
jgi:hypothetical protein